MKIQIWNLLIALLLAPAAFAATVEHLGQPCRAFNVLASRVVRDPGGKEWFVLSNTNETSGVELIFIDFATNTGKSYRAPAGQGAWLLNQIAPDRLAVGTYYDGKLMIFDLNKMEFTKVVPFPGEEYFWNGVIGGDGRLYGGTYPGAKLGALDLNTYALEDCGAPAPPNLYLRNVSDLPDGRILCNFVTSNPTTKIYDPASKKWSDPPAGMKHVQRTIVWNGYALSIGSWDSTELVGPIAFDGKTLAPIDPPPFPVPPGGTFAVDSQLTSPDTLYLRQGNAIYRLGKGEASLTKIFEQDFKGGGISAVASDGTLLGMRGQDYVIARPGETQGKLVPIPVEGSPRPMHFIKADDAGRLWGGPPFGQTVFYIDLATKKVTNTGNVCNAGGEVYDAVFLDGKTYLVAYVGGDVIEFDPAKPWDQLGDKNPKTIAHLTSRGYIRPEAGMRIGPDKKLYSGWMAKYGTYGGAIAITNPASGETKLIENPLGEQAISALDVDEKFIYAGTTLHGNGLGAKPGQPQFGVIDRATEKVVFQQAMPGGEVSKILRDAKTGRVVILAEGRLKFFDAELQKLTDAPADVPAVSGRALDATGDGHIWFASGNQVVDYNLGGGAMRKFDSPIAAQMISVKGSDAFVAAGPDVYRIAIAEK